MHKLTSVLVASSVRYWWMELIPLMSVYTALHALMMRCAPQSPCRISALQYPRLKAFFLLFLTQKGLHLNIILSSQLSSKPAEEFLVSFNWQNIKEKLSHFQTSFCTERRCCWEPFQGKHKYNANWYPGCLKCNYQNIWTCNVRICFGMSDFG